MHHPLHLVLSLYPSSRGLGYVLFETPLAPFDWGVKEVRGARKNAQAITFVKRLLDRYAPVVLVLGDWTAATTRRAKRIRDLSQSLAALAKQHSLPVVTFSTEKVRECFSGVGARTKYEIALAIAKQVPAFSFRVPPVRKLWMSEDPRQNLFDAAALGFTFFANVGGDRGTKEMRVPT